MERITTPVQFTAQQEKAWACASAHDEQTTLPTNADLISVLENWVGKICIEILSQQQPLIVQVIKKDFLAEMKLRWTGGEKTGFTISYANSEKQILVLTLY